MLSIALACAMLVFVSGAEVLAQGHAAGDRSSRYMLGGLTLMHAERSELQVQVGVGAQFRLVRRLGMAIDLRGNDGGSTMIVRPTAALIYNFR